MSGAAVVILLVGLVFPIAILLAAVLFDLLVMAWAVYRLWHDRWSAAVTGRIRASIHIPGWATVRGH